MAVSNNKKNDECAWKQALEEFSEWFDDTLKIMLRRDSAAYSIAGKLDQIKKKHGLPYNKERLENFE